MASGGRSSRRLRDLQRRKAEFAAARAQARVAAANVRIPLESSNLALVERLSNEAAAAFRQLATASWELARARDGTTV